LRQYVGIAELGLLSAASIAGALPTTQGRSRLRAG
jgi:hypothetical protein